MKKKRVPSWDKVLRAAGFVNVEGTTYDWNPYGTEWDSPKTLEIEGDLWKIESAQTRFSMQSGEPITMFATLNISRVLPAKRAKNRKA